MFRRTKNNPEIIEELQFEVKQKNAIHLQASTTLKYYDLTVTRIRILAPNKLRRHFLPRSRCSSKSHSKFSACWFIDCWLFFYRWGSWYFNYYVLLSINQQSGIQQNHQKTPEVMCDFEDLAQLLSARYLRLLH